MKAWSISRRYTGRLPFWPTSIRHMQTVLLALIPCGTLFSCKSKNKYLLCRWPQGLPSVLWRCWLGSRKGIWPAKKPSGEVLAWLSVWSKAQMICIWSSWCQCHPIISCSKKIQNALPFWSRLTQVVLEKRPLNRCSSSSRRPQGVIHWICLHCHCDILASKEACVGIWVIDAFLNGILECCDVSLECLSRPQLHHHQHELAALPTYMHSTHSCTIISMNSQHCLHTYMVQSATAAPSSAWTHSTAYIHTQYTQLHHHQHELTALPTYVHSTHSCTIISMNSQHCLHTYTVHTHAVVACHSGNVVGRINEVTLRRARLVEGWVTIFGG